MRFAQKLVLLVLALLGVIFTLGGTVLVVRVFENSLSDTIRHNTNAHILEKYALEADIISVRAAGAPLDDSFFLHYGERIAGYLESNGQYMALYRPGGASLYSNFPNWIPAAYIQDALQAADTGCVLRRSGETSYLLLAAPVGEDCILLNCYDITSIYHQREQNLLFFWQLNAAILLVSALFVGLFSAWLTRPVKKLNQASGHIASGNYSQRVHVATQDEIGELAQSFNRMAEAVEEKVAAMELSMRQKDDFVSAFTHEVKTPMTTLIGYAKILRTQECSPDVRQRAASSIYHEARRLETLSQRLLELMGLADTTPTLSTVDVAEVFAQCRRSLPQEVTQGVSVTYHAPPNTAVEAQMDLLVDLVRNLVLNAVAASRDEDSVVAKATLYERVCRITVTDTGCGVPAAELSRIQEPFYMVDKSRSRRKGATGLGLSIAQRIARLHNTELHFDSEVGQGTTVSFELSLSTGQQEEPQ